MWSWKASKIVWQAGHIIMLSLLTSYFTSVPCLSVPASPHVATVESMVTIFGNILFFYLRFSSGDSREYLRISSYLGIVNSDLAFCWHKIQFDSFTVMVLLSHCVAQGVCLLILWVCGLGPRWAWKSREGVFSDLACIFFPSSLVVCFL